MSNLLESKNHNLSSHSEPIVSIIVLTYNQLNYTKQCLNSIASKTRIPYEIIIVDNASTDDTDYYLLEFKRQIFDERKQRNGLPANYCRNVEIILNGYNKGFAAGNNVGIAQSQGQYVLLLNNDVVVTENWLEQLLLVAEQDETIGILGPVTNYISGWQLVNQVNYDTNSLEGLDRFANEWRATNQGSMINSWRVVGFCMLIKRSVINKIGGLDIRYGLGNFEDDDFCIRAAIAGFKTVIVKSCFVHHFGSKSFRALGDKYKKLLENNWEIFKQKWGIPSAIGYRDDYDISSVLNQPFKEDYHYCSILHIDKSPQTTKELAGQIMENIKIDIYQKNYDKIKVDIGCGSRKNQGFIGVDIYPWPGVDLVADLTKKFPFPDNTVDEIRAYDCLEHLPNIIHTMNEIWRICKPGATVDILVPSTDGRGAFQDPTHVSFWNINSFMYYSIEYRPYLELCRSYGFQGAFSILSLEHQESPGQVIHVRAILTVIKSDHTEIPVDIDDHDEIGDNLKEK
jgi:GT2 family glycosyltransferase